MLKAEKRANVRIWVTLIRAKVRLDAAGRLCHSIYTAAVLEGCSWSASVRIYQKGSWAASSRLIDTHGKKDWPFMSDTINSCCSSNCLPMSSAKKHLQWTQQKSDESNTVEQWPLRNRRRWPARINRISFYITWMAGSMQRLMERRQAGGGRCFRQSSIWKPWILEGCLARKREAYSLLCSGS